LFCVKKRLDSRKEVVEIRAMCQGFSGGAGGKQAPEAGKRDLDAMNACLGGRVGVEEIGVALRTCRVDDDMDEAILGPSVNGKGRHEVGAECLAAPGKGANERRLIRSGELRYETVTEVGKPAVGVDAGHIRERLSSNSRDMEADGNQPAEGLLAENGPAVGSMWDQCSRDRICSRRAEKKRAPMGLPDAGGDDFDRRRDHGRMVLASKRPGCLRDHLRSKP
jgi:hypothetical protein